MWPMTGSACISRWSELIWQAVIELKRIAIIQRGCLCQIHDEGLTRCHRQPLAAQKPPSVIQLASCCRAIPMTLAMQGLCDRKLCHGVLSEHEVALGHRQHVGGLAGQQNAVRPHFVGFGVYVDLRQGIVQDHVGLANGPRVFHRNRLF